MALWTYATSLVLASQSPTRRAVLTAAGIPLEIRPSDLDERALEAGTSGEPSDLAVLLAREKARSVGEKMPGRLVLGADQILALAGRRFNKPVDRAGAREQLQMLRGRTHELHSAIAVARGTAILFHHVEATRLTMRDVSDAFLDEYLERAGSAVTTSVGGYQLEGIGIHLFERIRGDYFAILGLPLLPLLAFLRTEKALA
jgi:septum formation protein